LDWKLRQGWRTMSQRTAPNLRGRYNTIIFPFDGRPEREGDCQDTSPDQRTTNDEEPPTTTAAPWGPRAPGRARDGSVASGRATSPCAATHEQ
jgi:hypothetical protein